MNIINIFNNTPFTTSLVIAENCNNRSHESTIKLIRKYQSDFDALGKLDFKSDLNKQGIATEYALLNEDQATYLITLFRNTPIVRQFKLRLVKEFRNALDEIQRLNHENSLLRVALQLKRDAHNPMIQELTEQRLSQGKVTEHHHWLKYPLTKYKNNTKIPIRDFR